MENQKTSKRSIIIGVLAVVSILALSGWYVLRQELPARDGAEGQATSTKTIGGLTMDIPEGGGVTVEQVSIEDIGSAPQLDRAVAFPSYFNLEAQSIWLAKVQTLKEMIAREPYSYKSWNNLALLRDDMGDYEGAGEIWEYLVKLYPTDGIVFSNLGFLYGYHFHDNVRAEQYFQTALKNAPQAVQIYQQTFEFYRDVLKDTAKARVVAEEGKEKTGNVEFFNQLLSTL